MTESAAELDRATPEQMDELRSLAPDGEEIPSGMTRAEAAQRLVELRTAG